MLLAVQDANFRTLRRWWWVVFVTSAVIGLAVYQICEYFDRGGFFHPSIDRRIQLIQRGGTILVGGTIVIGHFVSTVFLQGIFGIKQEEKRVAGLFFLALIVVAALVTVVTWGSVTVGSALKSSGAACPGQPFNGTTIPQVLLAIASIWWPLAILLLMAFPLAFHVFGGPA